MTYPEPLALATDEVHVWWAHARPRSSELLGYLDPIELTRHSALRRAGDRDRFASAHALARVALAGYLTTYVDEVPISASCKVCGAEGHGKPVLADASPPLTFSLAYAGARVGVAVARVPVGLDVVVMSEEQPHPKALTWARREALLKATGDGLSVPLVDVRVSPPGDDPALLDWAGGPDPKTVQLADLAPGAGHVAALALITAETGGPESLPFSVVERDGEPLLAAAEPPSIA